MDKKPFKKFVESSRARGRRNVRTLMRSLVEEMDVRLFGPMNRFIRTGGMTGIILFLVAFIAILWANSPWRETYFQIWHYEFSFKLAGFKLEKNIHHWINDGLMAMFFFLVGLEIKREIIAGELSSVKKAALPVGAALGGMIIPASVYFLINMGDGGDLHGWGIPMATDIAFALGLLTLVKSRVPTSVKVFMTGVAIVDDIGAVLVIAFFYTSEIYFINLLVGAVFMLILIGGNLWGIRNITFYGVFGIGGLWLAFLLSGVHATIAGVLAAFTIPARVDVEENEFVRSLKRLTKRFDEADPNQNPLVTREQLRLIERVRKLAHAAQTPIQRLERHLTSFVYYVIMPLFALANAGIAIGSNVMEVFFHPVALGVAFGLFVGKFIGVVGVSKLLVNTGLAKLPKNATWTHIYGVGFLAGIGFTMSLFITELAFADEDLVLAAKVGILSSSILAIISGLTLLRFGSPHVEQDDEDHDEH